MLRSAMVVVVACLVSMTSQSGWAVIVFQDGFENAVSVPGDTAGTPVVGESWTLHHRNDAKTKINLSGAANTGSKAMLMHRIDYPSGCSADANLSATSTALVDTKGHAAIAVAIRKDFYDLSSASAYIQVYNGDTSVSANRGISVGFGDDGRVTYHDGVVAHDTGLTYTLGEYQDVVVDIDFDTHTFAVAVEGATTANSIGIPFISDVDTMTAAVFGIGKGLYARFDDVLIVVNPAQAYSPTPENGDDSVPLDQILQWEPPLITSGDTITYEVFLSTDPCTLGSGTDVGTDTFFDPSPDLLEETRYYWRVDVHDPNFGVPRVVTGDVWFFDTVSGFQPATLVSPANSDDPTVDPTVTLDWDSDTDAVTHEVYLRLRDGTWNLEASIDAPGDTFYSPTGLVFDQAYDWRVDEVFPGSVTITGPTWQFATHTPVCSYALVDSDGDCIITLVDFALFASHWLQCGYDIPAACGVWP